METKPVWRSARIPKFPKVEEGGRFDVVVVGGGITGLTAAYLLKKAGKNVCVLEKNTIGSGDTGYTTAHLTAVTDLRLSKLAKQFGKDAARLVWQGGAAAVNTIERIAQAERIACEFRRVPGFLHASLNSESDEAASLRNDAELAEELGFDASLLAAVPLVNRPGILFSNQAKFHPLKYLAGLAKAVEGDGCAVFEHSEMEETDSDPLSVKANGHRIVTDYLFIATHVPLMGEAGLVSATLFQTKLASYSSYALGAKIPKATLSESLFWDTSDPYFYLRIDAGKEQDYAIFGGLDHKTGQVKDTEKIYGELEQKLHAIIPTANVDHRWSGQVVETHDGLPYIGETAERQFVATGFGGNGMTFGTLSAMMVTDHLTNRDNPWRELFSVDRKKLSGTWDFVKENFDYPYYLLKDRLTSSPARSVEDILPGEGDVVTIDRKRVACSRDDQGKLAAVSAVCTHMGCLVHWNAGESTWDCPCHGSRFKANGEVMGGPAESPLEPVQVDDPVKQASAAQTRIRQRPRSAGASRGHKSAAPRSRRT